MSGAQDDTTPLAVATPTGVIGNGTDVRLVTYINGCVIPSHIVSLLIRLPLSLRLLAGIVLLIRPSDPYRIDSYIKTIRPYENQKLS